jgi:steroid delta-isomerase-like uncharacterized protein
MPWARVGSEAAAESRFRLQLQIARVETGIAADSAARVRPAQPFDGTRKFLQTYGGPVHRLNYQAELMAAPRQQQRVEKAMTINNTSEAAKAVVRRNTEEVQGGGNFEVFDELFADDFLDHTPQPGRTPDKDGARQLYKILRTAFPDFHAEIHWQLADGDRVTTYKTYHGTHRGGFLGVAPTGRKIQFETVDVMRVRNGKITEHWGVANLFSLMQQLGAWPAKQDRAD